MSEDLEREPDGIPHVVIAAILVGSLAIAAMLLVIVSGHVPRHPGARVVLGGGLIALGVIVAVMTLRWRRPTAHA